MKLCSEYILKMEPYEKYADGLGVRMRERTDSRMTLRFVAWAARRVKLPFSGMGKVARRAAWGHMRSHRLPKLTM